MATRCGHAQWSSTLVGGREIGRCAELPCWNYVNKPLPEQEGPMNEAVITFVGVEQEIGRVGYSKAIPYTKVVRVEFEGPVEHFLQYLEGWLNVQSAVKIVNIEHLVARDEESIADHERQGL